MRIIFDETDDNYIEEEKKFLKEEYPELSETEIEQWAYDSINNWLEDERTNLDIELPSEIVIIANLGLWNGRRVGIKTTRHTNIKDILCHQLSGISEIKFYCDRYNLKADESHHDGTNHYTYRMVRENRDIGGLVDRICRGDKITPQIINYYTESLVDRVNKVYGW